MNLEKRKSLFWQRNLFFKKKTNAAEAKREGNTTAPLGFTAWKTQGSASEKLH